MNGQFERSAAIEAPGRETHIQSQMSRQGDLVAQLSEGLAQLEKRISPILRSGMPKEISNDGKDKPSLVGHAIALSNQNDQLSSLVRQIADIYDRIEL